MPVDDFELSDADIKAGRVLMVDVGGGSGHQCLGLRKAFPDLKGKMVVQDVPIMIQQIDQYEAAEAELEPMPHDFLTPQPVKAAKVYYLRWVLRDWNDDVCRTILGQLRPAIAPDSVVVIDELIIP